MRMAVMESKATGQLQYGKQSRRAHVASGGGEDGRTASLHVVHVSLYF